MKWKFDSCRKAWKAAEGLHSKIRALNASVRPLVKSVYMDACNAEVMHLERLLSVLESDPSTRVIQLTAPEQVSVEAKSRKIPRGDIERYITKSDASEVIHLAQNPGGLFGGPRNKPPVKVPSVFAHVADPEARAMLERLHPNGLPKPAAISPAPKPAAPVAPQTWTEKCAAAKKNL